MQRSASVSHHGCREWACHHHVPTTTPARAGRFRASFPAKRPRTAAVTAWFQSRIHKTISGAAAQGCRKAHLCAVAASARPRLQPRRGHAIIADGAAGTPASRLGRRQPRVKAGVRARRGRHLYARPLCRRRRGESLRVAGGGRRNVLTDDSADGARRLRRQLVRRSRNAASITRLDVLTRQHMATVPRPGSGLRTYSSYSSLPSVAPMIHSYSVQTLLNPHDADKPWSKSRFVLNDRFSPAAVAVPQKKVTRVILADSEQQPKNASRSSAVPTGKYPLGVCAGAEGLHNQNNKRPPSASKRPGVTPLAPPSHRPPPPQPPPPWPSNQPSRWSRRRRAPRPFSSPRRLVSSRRRRPRRRWHLRPLPSRRR